MTIKSFLPLLIVGIFFLGACNPENPAETEELTESKEEALAEQQLASGKTIYEANCAGCHDAGVAGAPKPGETAVWNERMAQGMNTVVKKSIEGFEGKTGMMPPKGGNAVLTDEEITNAVTFMIRTPIKPSVND